MLSDGFLNPVDIEFHCGQVVNVREMRMCKGNLHHILSLRLNP